MQTAWIVLDHIGGVMRGQLPWALGLMVLFTALSLMQSQACNPGRPWWKSRDLLADVQYCFLLPIITPYARMVVLLVIVAGLRSFMSESDISDYLNHNRGPVGQLPFWAQVTFYVIGTDFLLYWAHRTFHKAVLWPFHAVHHSALDVDWTTAYRAHPVNQMFGSGLVTIFMILMGVPSEIMIAMIPFDTLSSAFVHANLNWTLGPLKYVVATPVFHRWHHTQPDQGGECNFSSTFAIWDYLFGTYYMPEGQLPQEYGVDDPHFPVTWTGQMIVPFKQFLDKLQQPAKTPT